jgi:hypothetical protein
MNDDLCGFGAKKKLEEGAMKSMAGFTRSYSLLIIGVGASISVGNPASSVRSFNT